MFAKIKRPHAKFEPRIAAKGEKARKTAFVCEDQIRMLQKRRGRFFLHPSLALAGARSSEAYALNLLRYGARRRVPVALVVVAWSPLERSGLIGRSALEVDVNLDPAVPGQTRPEPRLLELEQVSAVVRDNGTDLPPILPEGLANAPLNRVHRSVIGPMDAAACAWAPRQLRRNHD